MDRVRLALFAGLASLVAACSSPGASPGDVDEALDPNTEPITVRTSTDASSAVSATVGLEGGTLTVASSDGTRFTLVIPAQSLSGPTTITMTPLASMEGVPFGEGSPMAVELAPSGLTFFDFVTLTVEPGQTIPIDQQIPIAASGTDNSLEMPYADIADGVLRLKILHFSSAGATKGFLADTEPWRQRLGGDVEARLRSIVAWELLHHQQRGESVPASFWEWLKKTWWDSVMKPRLDAARESCAAGRLAIATAVGFGRESQLLGFAEDGSGFVQVVLDLLPEVARKCLQEEYEICRDEHVVHRIVPALLGAARDSQLMGTAEANDDRMAQVLAEGEELARRCLRFEMVFESSADGTSPSLAGSYHTGVEAKVSIKLEGSISAADLGLRGRSALENTEFTWEGSVDPACSLEAVRGGATFIVDELNWDASPPDASHPYGYVNDIQLTYAPGLSTESLVAQCRGLKANIPGGFWSLSYAALHPEEIVEMMPQLTYLTAQWEVKGGELFAIKEWAGAQTTSDGTVSEAGTFELYHRPQ